MRRLLLAAAVCSCAFAQTQGFAPQAVDSFQDAAHMNGGTGACTSPTVGCVNFTEGVNNNDLIVCAAGQEDATDGCGTGSNPPWTFSDTASFSWTMETAGANLGSAGSNTRQYLQMGYACATSTQSTYRATWNSPATGPPGCIASFNCIRVKNACTSGTITTDGFQQNAAATTSSINPISNSLTTTKLNDFVVSSSQISPNNGGNNRLQTTGTLTYANSYQQGVADLAYQIAPSLGSNTFTWDDYGSTHNSTQAQTLAFQIPIIIGDSAIPQGGNGVAYSAQLHCYGGTSATPTYALASGSFPSGVSLTAATGLISGTPAATGTFNVGVNCTDGTNTSSTRSLTMSVGNALGVPQVISTRQATFSNGGGSVSVPASACGDVVVLQAAAADDTHGDQGYPQSISGSANFVHSSDGSPVQQYFLAGGNFAGPLVTWVVGPLLTAGTQTITVANNTNSASGLLVNVTDIRGAQAVLDAPVVNSTVNNSSSGTISASYTTKVPNQLLLVATDGAQWTGNFNGMSFNSPISLAYSSGNSTYISAGFGTGLITSPSTITATTNLSASGVGGCGSFNLCEGVSTMVTSIRPGFDSSCPAFLGQGEKHRRIGD